MLDCVDLHSYQLPCAIRYASRVAQDLVELRYNSWIARREVEGPKKINQVHADAKRDDANRARAAAGAPGPRGRGDYNRGPSNLDAYGGPPQR